MKPSALGSRVIWATCAMLPLLGGMLRLIARPVTDPDVWWVAAAGRQMLQTGTWMRTNTFSFTAPDQSWVMHEWLFAIPYALGLEHVGPEVFRVFALASFALAAALMLASTLRGGKGGAWLSVLAFVFYFERFETARPTHLALLFALAMAALAWNPELGRARWVAAAVLEWVWAQAHGSFPLGVVMLASGAWLFPSQRRARWALTAVAAALTVLNPYGLALHRLVFDYTLGRGVFALVRAALEEFQPAWRGYGLVGSLELFVGYPVMAALVALALATPTERKRGVVGLALLALGVLQLRHYQLAGLLICAVTAPVLDVRWPNAKAWSLRTAGAVVAAMALLSGVLWAARKQPGLEAMGDQSALARLASQLPDGAKAYAGFERGGVVLWYGWPRARMYVDPRNDCYPAPVLLTALQDDEARAEQTAEALSAAGTNTVLLRDQPALQQTLTARGFAVSGSDGDWRTLTR